MNEPGQKYFAYLLRLFQVVEDGLPVWRVTLQEPGSDRRQKFVSVQEFVEFVITRTEPPQGSSVHHQLVERKLDEDTTIEIKLLITTRREE